ncbi:MAG: GGDEF domain-containing protein, partial [Actinobacteria bacterium]|nr:GGDEF domain-containing protein [Actinomycetota bacterium]
MAAGRGVERGDRHCYVLISLLILQGLTRTRQLTTNSLAVATAAIFTTCALHHGHLSLELLIPFGGAEHAQELAAARAAASGWHMVLIDALGATVGIIYLGLRRSYKALLNTPAMFDDAVRVAAERQLRELAFTDLLTGIPNRAAYQLHADQLAGDGRPVAVLFVDLDGFKAINDQHGHDAGDRLLREVAQHLAAAVGKGEAVFRLGGDEFVVVAVGCEASAAQALVERMRCAIARPVSVRDGTVGIAAS